MAKSKRNSTLDVIKGLLIVFVLITHYDWTSKWRDNPVFPFVIDMAIPCFMIITGYVYTISLKEHYTNNIWQSYSIKTVFNRVLRYSIPFVVLVIWEIIDRNVVVNATGIELLKWVLNGTEGKGTYYYPVMIQIVFLFPLLFCIFRHYGRKSLWICFAINAIYELLMWSYDLELSTYRLLCFRYVFVIGAGIYIGLGYRFKIGQSIILTLIGGAFIFATKYLGYDPFILKMWTGTSFVSCLLIIPFMAFVISNVHIHCAPIELIGRATYNIFIVQIVYYLAYFDKSNALFSSWKIHFLFGLVVSLVLGVLFYLVESRITRWFSAKAGVLIDKFVVSDTTEVSNSKHSDT